MVGVIYWPHLGVPGAVRLVSHQVAYVPASTDNFLAFNCKQPKTSRGVHLWLMAVASASENAGQDTSWFIPQGPVQVNETR